MKSTTKLLGLFCLLLSFTACSNTVHGQEKKIYPYQNPKNPIDFRVKDLIQRMSLEEKVYQLRSEFRGLSGNKLPNFQVGNARGAGGNTPRACATAINEDTRKSMNANRWGIPPLQHGESLHGVLVGNFCTSFPQSIAIAASFDESCCLKVSESITRELRALGIRQALSPSVNVSRDPRWGRMEESYGEDAFLNSRMGVIYTQALEQGGVIATPKPLVDNYGEGGHDSYASTTSWRVLREVFLEPYRACIEEGGARSIMSAYNSVDGVPCSSSSVLLRDILRNEWKFKGFVVSDYNSVGGVYRAHHTAKDAKEAQAQTINAGLDVELHLGYPDLLDQVKQGRVSEKTINASVERVLRCKFQLGLFEEPFVDPDKAEASVNNSEHKQIALESAQKVMTLLKNRDNMLPLSDQKVKKIGLFGPGANILSLGGYSRGANKNDITPYQAITKRLEGNAEVVLHKVGENVTAVAQSCDVVIFFGVINESEGGDRSRLTLPSKPMKVAESLTNAAIVDAKSVTSINVDQEKMIEELVNSGANTIVVLQNGSPIDISSWGNRVDAILEAWYSGEEGPTAIARTLFGDNNPGGRLPVTWPKHVGQVPVYYSVKPSGRGYAYNDDDGKPLFPFGFGLSYTKFAYSNLVLPEKVQKKGDTEVKVTVKNIGPVKGDEVVQLYLHDEMASVVRPVKELKAFKRVTLEPGESKEVILKLPYRSFGLWNKDMKFVVEPGAYKVYIGTNAADSQLDGILNID
jgi:beta-glucosidase